MKAMGRLCEAFLKLGGQDHQFCMVLQIGQWYWTLSKGSEEEAIVHYGGEQRLQKRENRMRPVFDVESMDLQYPWAVEIYHETQNVPEEQHTNLCKHAVLFCRIDVSKKGFLGLLDYHRTGEIRTTHRRLLGGRT